MFIYPTLLCCGMCNFVRFILHQLGRPRNDSAVSNVVNEWLLREHVDLCGGVVFYAYQSQYNIMWYFTGAENSGVNDRCWEKGN